MHRCFLSKCVLCAGLSLAYIGALPAHAVSLDVKDSLNLSIWGNVSPAFKQSSSKFNYTYGDPKIYGAAGTMAQVLADQDREDRDERARLSGVNTSGIGFVVQQSVGKNISLFTHLSADFYPKTNGGVAFWAAPWGFSATHKDLGSFEVGSGWANLGVSQTSARNILSKPGSHAKISYTQIPNLTVNALYLFNAANDIRNKKDLGLHKAQGVSAEYIFDFTPQQSLTIAAGVAKSRGHEDVYSYAQPTNTDDLLASAAYQYNKLTISADVGKSTRQHNKTIQIWGGLDKVQSKLYGVKLEYEITPRLSATIDYYKTEAKNNNPVHFSDFVTHRKKVKEETYFNKVNEAYYGARMDYQILSNIKVFAAGDQEVIKNYLVDGEFSRRTNTNYTAGARFSF